MKKKRVLQGDRGSAKKSNASTNPDRLLGKKVTGSSFYRDKSTIRRLNMYNSKPDTWKMHKEPIGPVRIQPDSRWFGNTRVLSLNKLQSFRDEIAEAVKDPFQIALKSCKLPMSLLSDKIDRKTQNSNLLALEPFSGVFGKQSVRKRPKLSCLSIGELSDMAQDMRNAYTKKDDLGTIANITKSEQAIKLVSDPIFKKGTSRRIWRELYKVVDSSDVILEVIDARDPMGTRCLKLEQEIRKTRPGKHIVLVMNKTDLVPVWITQKWLAFLNKEIPTIAFHASITNPFGISAMFQMIRQFGQVMDNRKHVSIGLIGYPNVGKSSVINAMKKKKVCTTASIPGETKVWQYVSLTRRIFLIDCPGIVPDDDSDREVDKLLKGCIRPERIHSPSSFIHEIFGRVGVDIIRRKYGLPEVATVPDESGDMDPKKMNGEDLSSMSQDTVCVQDINEDFVLKFLSDVAIKMGRLLKGGDPDIEGTARAILFDWQRGRISYFCSPPSIHLL